MIKPWYRKVAKDFIGPSTISWRVMKEIDNKQLAKDRLRLEASIAKFDPSNASDVATKPAPVGPRKHK